MDAGQKHRKDPLYSDYRHLKKSHLLGKSLAGNEKNVQKRDSDYCDKIRKYI